MNISIERTLSATEVRALVAELEQVRATEAAMRAAAIAASLFYEKRLAQCGRTSQA
jgi:hypothetical protein